MKNFLLNYGIKNIKIIYNSYDLEQYNFKSKKIINFKKKYNLNIDKPVIYIGPNNKGKGILNLLKFLDKTKYKLITTGNPKNKIKGVTNFFFSKEEFRFFLRSCDLVICYSIQTEGWNRIAHESLLSKTPVIGSGIGGMKELLAGSSQVVLTDITLLETEIERVLSRSKYFGNLGFNFVSKFNSEYFENTWLETINSLNS